jgi:hypothetical protein
LPSQNLVEQLAAGGDCFHTDFSFQRPAATRKLIRGTVEPPTEQRRAILFGTTVFGRVSSRMPTVIRLPQADSKRYLRF